MVAPDLPYLTEEQVREARPNLASIDSARITGAVRSFELVVEDYYQRACTPRTRTAPGCYWRWAWLRLPDVGVTEVTAATVDGVSQGDLPLALVTPDRLGDLVSVPGSWTLPVTTTAPVLTYIHGDPDGPNELLLDACAEYVEAVSIARNSGVSRNVLSQAADGGTTRYSTPNKAEGRPTGWLEVDRLINSAGQPISGIA